MTTSSKHLIEIILDHISKEIGDSHTFQTGKRKVTVGVNTMTMYVIKESFKSYTTDFFVVNLPDNEPFDIDIQENINIIQPHRSEVVIEIDEEVKPYSIKIKNIERV